MATFSEHSVERDDEGEVSHEHAARSEPVGRGDERTLPLVPVDAPSPAGSIRALDVCPNCGAPMRGRDTLVCLRCGFDLKSMRVVRTEVGEEEAKPSAGEEAGALPLVKPAPGEPAVPLVMAGISATALAIGTLLGARALFPWSDAELTIGWSARLLELVRLPGLAAIWTMCGLVGLAAGAWLLGRSFGDVRIALCRVAGMVCAALVARYIDLPSGGLEMSLEALAMAALYYLLLLLLFRLKLRDAATVLGLTAAGYVGIWGAAHLVTWLMR